MGDSGEGRFLDFNIKVYIHYSTDQTGVHGRQKHKPFLEAAPLEAGGKGAVWGLNDLPAEKEAEGPLLGFERMSLLESHSAGICVL